MKLRTFSLVILFLILLVGISFITIISYTVIDTAGRSLEEEEIASLLTKATIVLRNQQQELSYLTIDWAEWNDTYNLIQDSSPYIYDEYSANNLNLPSLTNLNLDLVLVMNRTGDVIIARALNAEEDGFEPVPDKLLSLGGHKDMFANLSLEDTPARTGIIRLPRDYAMISWHPVVTSDQNAEPVGVLIFGRYMDEGLLSDLTDIVGNSLYLRDTMDLTGYQPIVSESAVNSNSSAWMIRNKQTLIGYSSIRDITNESSLLMGVQTSSESIDQQKNTQLLFLITVVLLSLIFFIASYTYFDHRILVRLQSIINQVKTISSDVDLNREHHIQMEGNDEIAFLAEEINRMVKGLEVSKHELSVSEALNRELIDNIPEYVIVYGSTNKILYANQKSCSYTGLSLDEFVGRSIFDFVSELDLKKVKTTVMSRKKGLKLPPYELRFVSPSGERKYGMVSGAEVTYKNQQAYLILISDITWREDAEETLKALNRNLTLEKEKAQSYFELAGSLFLTLDTSGFVTLINQKGCEILGLSRDEIIGKNWFFTFLPERLREPVSGVFTDLMAGHLEPVEYYENPVLTATGEERILAWHNSILYDEKGIITGVLCSADDITEKMQIEKEREELIRELEQKNTELERFVYMVSHDLKSPLITIEGFLGYLDKDIQKPDPTGVQDDIKRIRNATKKMSSILQDLLELSRIGRMVNPSVDILLSELAEEARELVSGLTEMHHVSVIIMPNLPVIHVDHTRFLEVMTNLIENAAKFMGDQQDPRIEIGGKDRGTDYVFYVKDNGIGIEKQYHEKIFGLFEKLLPKSDGSGIGLAIVKRIIELHGGTIWVESEPGIGTTFYFTIPMNDT